MIDLTSALREALERRSCWGKELFVVILHQIAQAFGNATIDWDSGVPEQWGSVWDKEGNGAAKICLRFPLAILADDAKSDLVGLLKANGLICVVAPNWSERLFSIESQILREAFGLDEVSRAINPECFSIDELWYATVTA